MAIEITNGAACSRFFSDGSGELLAVFQYTKEAKDWAKEKVLADKSAGMETTIVVTCLYSGRSEMFAPPVPA